MTHGNQGINEKRVATHNAHAGLRKLNKWELSIFPFHWRARQPDRRPAQVRQVSATIAFAQIKI